jgi:glutathione synthase/RimK-type ligase-like ATP-grasp enzyme
MTRPRVYITVNPELIAGKRMQTVRSMVTALHEICDLYVIPVDAIDFGKGKARAFRRIKGGRFKSIGPIENRADLWIVWTDGYYLDSADQGYEHRSDYIRAQLDFYEKLLANGTVSQVVNLPEGERRTLKKWFATLDCEKLKIIPTFVPKTANSLRDLVRREGVVVVKPDWGGASTGVVKLSSQKEVDEFLTSGIDLRDCVCQSYREGAEKRLWFVGNECVGGRIVTGRKTPWSAAGTNHKGENYSSGKKFARDREVAQRVWDKSLLSIGSVDFIGDEVNEINGCGTTFVYYVGWDLVVDARQPLVDYLTDVVINLSK